MTHIEEQEQKLNDLKDWRKNLWKERTDIDNKIAELDRRKDELTKEIEMEKSKSMTGYIGQFIKYEDIYMFVKKTSNAYNRCDVAFAGPHFRLYNSIYDKKKFAFKMDSSDGDIEHNPTVMVDNIKDIQIITKKEFMDAYDSYFNKSRDILASTVENI